MALLEVEAVTVRFGGITAVDGASLTVQAGSVTGLIGPNGAGKTTLFDVISGLQAPTSGAVRFRGVDVTSLRVDRRARRGMARTFQRLEAFGSLTVRENVQAARDIHAGPWHWIGGRHDRRVDELIEIIGLTRYAHQRADSVPTGVARLLEIARVLAVEPALLLLDEPSAGLDRAESRELGALLRRVAVAGRAVLMVEHDMELVMGVCDRIHVLDSGRVIAAGSPAQIRNDPAVQAAYLGGDPVGVTVGATVGAPGGATVGAPVGATDAVVPARPRPRPGPGTGVRT